MTSPARRRNPVLSVLAALAALAVVAGVIVGAIALPVAGLVGIGARDAAETFNGLIVPALSGGPTRSEILDSRGGVIAYYYPNHIYRIPVSYSQISPDMRAAIVAIEDSRYYQHGALDIRGTFRAVTTDLSGGQVQGGSTLAQQYVKNALLLTAADAAEQKAAVADSAARKIRELRMAANVEHELTPDQLLAAYLNVAYFENEAYGVEVAAERYFATTAAKLTLTQAAMLAGLVQNPAQFDPLAHPAAAVARRNVVLARMAQLHDITGRAAAAAEKAPAGLHFSTLSFQEGCTSASAATAAWFCDYVLAELRTNPAYGSAWQQMNTTGGLKIYTTMNPQDQSAAQNAVSFMLPSPPSGYNPGANAAAEVLIQPGTGNVQAIAVDRRYGTGPGENSIDYAVDTPQDGGFGVQTGSSSKLFTLITALEANYPFGFQLSVSSPAQIGPFDNCAGTFAGSFPVSNAEGAGKGTYSLYTGTTQSINVFFAELEQRVGLCNVVKTAVSMGVHRADGSSLLTAAGKPGTPGYQLPADDLPSFTLGSVNVSPMTMAAAYATVAVRRRLLPARRDRADHRREPPAPRRHGRLPPGAVDSGRRGHHVHPAGRANVRYCRGRRRHQERRLPAAGRQNRHGQQLRLRRLRRVHAHADRLRLDVQPVRASDASDGGLRLVLSRRGRRRGLPWLGLRRQCRPDLAANLRVSRPRRQRRGVPIGARLQQLLQSRNGAAHPGQEQAPLTRGRRGTSGLAGPRSRRFPALSCARWRPALVQPRYRRAPPSAVIRSTERSVTGSMGGP